VVPALALILAAWRAITSGNHLGFPPSDIITGFLPLGVVSFFSFRRLKRPDSCHSIEIVNVLLDPWDHGYPGCYGGTKHDRCISKC